MNEEELLQIIEQAAKEGVTSLDLSGKELSALPPEITQLTNLKELFLDNNQLSALPPEITQLTNLKELSLDNNPLTSPPPEIVEQGTQAILVYLRERLQDSQQQFLLGFPLGSLPVNTASPPAPIGVTVLSLPIVQSKII